MNPQNGEIYAMVNWPEFNLNEPFELPEGTTYDSEDEKQELLNQMWRNGCINDTYEPGSTFKSSPPAPVWRRGSLIWMIRLSVRDTRSWRIGGSGATR